MRSKIMSYPAHAKAVATLGLPLVGGHLAQIAIGVTDTVMLGWYGVDALAAVTLAASYFLFFFLWERDLHLQSCQWSQHLMPKKTRLAFVA